MTQPEPNKRKPITAKVRRQVWERYGGRCGYCGKAVEFRSDDQYTRMQVDHIHPVIDGGTNDLANLMSACHACNYWKNAMLLERFRYANLVRRSGHSTKVWFYPKQLEWIAERLQIDVIAELEREHGPHVFWFEQQEALDDAA